MTKSIKTTKTAKTPAFSLCVYCGSRPGVDPAYADTARAVGRWIGQHQGQLVYGGGHNGLMGLMADAALAAGATVVGVIPQALEGSNVSAIEAMTRLIDQSRSFETQIRIIKETKGLDESGATMMKNA